MYNMVERINDMQNKITQITWRFLTLLVLTCLITLPALAQDCAGWEDKSGDYWGNITLEEVQTCLDNGADVHAHNKYRFTALHSAAFYNTDSNIIITLVLAGANVRARASYGNTPLHFAVAHNENLEVIMHLLDSGANVNARNEAGYTPLHWGAGQGINPEVIMILLQSGADGKAKNSDGKTPFDLAKENNVIKDTEAYWLLNDAQF